MYISWGHHIATHVQHQITCNHQEHIMATLRSPGLKSYTFSGAHIRQIPRKTTQRSEPSGMFGDHQSDVPRHSSRSHFTISQVQVSVSLNKLIRTECTDSVVYGSSSKVGTQMQLQLQQPVLYSYKYWCHTGTQMQSGVVGL